MSSFTRLKQQFGANWTTALVGWRGLGALSPWPERWADFPSLLSVDDLLAFADERLASSSDVTEDESIIGLLSLNLHSESRETILEHLARLAKLGDGDPSRELRKWRAVLLEDLLDGLAADPLDGMMAFSEFWQNFGFPPDSPHEIQGRGNTVHPAEYYGPSNYHQVVSRHRQWLARERSELCGVRDR